MEGSSTKGPSYHIPKEELVREAIDSILKEAFTVRSQTLFHRLVIGKLKELVPERTKLSPKRLRWIAAKMKDVDLIIHCREAERTSKMTICPVCGTRMDDIKNSTLYGWTVATGKICPICSYWTGTRRRIPIRYVFTIEKENYLGNNMEDA